MLFSWIWKKNSTGEGKAALTDIAWGRHSRRTQPTDGLRSHGTNRSRLRKPLNLDLPSLTGRLQLPTLQRPKPEGGTQETEPESGWGTARGFFLTRPKIRPTRGLNPRPQGATREPPTSGLRTFRLFFMNMTRLWDENSTFLLLYIIEYTLLWFKLYPLSSMHVSCLLRSYLFMSTSYHHMEVGV
jgi:hypothetical protein